MKNFSETVEVLEEPADSVVSHDFLLTKNKVSPTTKMRSVLAQSNIHASSALKVRSGLVNR
jgi:hypothetical protein